MEYKSLDDAATKLLGIAYLFPYQRLVIANTLDALISASEDKERPVLRQMVILPTGSGKSACFQLPAVLAAGLTVVVYPLLGLMADQARRLRDGSIPALVLQGGMSPEEKKTALAQLASGSVRLALCNPEILRPGPILSALSHAKPHTVVIDEAHCVSEWGDTFRPAYLGLGETIQALNPACVTAFTATASPPVVQRVAHILFQDHAYEVVSASSDRPSIHYGIVPTLSMSRAVRLALMEMPRPMLVFVPSREGSALWAMEMRRSGMAAQARFYHAGLSKIERSELERWFLSSDKGILAATCAYGLGMDKKNIRSVVHVGVPASVEAFLQESGRAGRDGEQAFSRIIIPWREKAPQDGRKLAMHRWASESLGCRRSSLLTLIGQEGAESTPCLGPDNGCGCDACAGSAVAVPNGLDAITGALKAHPWRFRLPELAQYLLGTGSAGYGPQYGALYDWQLSELVEAIGRCVSGKAARYGLWLRKHYLAQGLSPRGNPRRPAHVLRARPGLLPSGAS